ncbi:hypothetical protein ES707_11019 [subsurface metagenome]
MTYAEQLKDPRWQKKRLKIFERDNFTCRSCGSYSKTLNVHHRYYIQNKKAWAYPDNLLITLCEECHKYEQGFLKDVYHDIPRIFLMKHLPSELIVIMQKYVAGHIEFGFSPGFKLSEQKPKTFKEYLNQSLNELRDRNGRLGKNS